MRPFNSRPHRYILNEQGEPVPEPDLLNWAIWFETATRHLAEDKLPNGTRVSTVFLGLDHNFGGDVPLLFETMIFGGEHDQEQWRYATKEEALAGHAHAKELALSTGGFGLLRRLRIKLRRTLK